MFRFGMVSLSTLTDIIYVLELTIHNPNKKMAASLVHFM